MADTVKILTADWGRKDSHLLATYLESGGYETAREVFSKYKPEDVTAQVKASGLRGRGGAGFPTGLKWSFLPKDHGKPVYLCCNADEGEPGTFKDRYILELSPHMLIEGMIIASYAIGCHEAYIYVRGEFVFPIERLQGAIDEAYAAGILGPDVFGNTGFALDIIVHSGAGAYVCGEETALIESIEGKKGQPRLKPPFPAVVGLFGCPTIVNNVESLATVPWILKNGGEAYAKLGTEKSKGTKLFSISGPVNKPGVYEVELGFPLKRFIDELCGGMKAGSKLKAVIPGGSSTPILTAEEVETLNLDYECCQAAGTMLGSGAIIVMDDKTDMVDAITTLAHFYAHESCGQCTPCRWGTDWCYKILKRINEGKGQPGDIETLLEVTANMMGTTVCPLSDAAAMPIQGFLKKFRPEFEARIKG
ncbi:MAG: NADH-quinone oxidoreductase subunit NuoF [Deltaproteobacteria bacterium]|nr:NADH-quinone oxidoreductase subunit NuoF [Deltaproteobacteria bacterium]